MKKLYLVTLFLSIGAAIQAANLLPNPGFENGADWWYFQPAATPATATVDYASSEAHSGNYGAHVNVLIPAPSASYSIQLSLPASWVAKAVKYKLTFWAKADKNLPIQLAVQDGSSNHYQYRTGFNFSLNTEWKFCEVIYTSDKVGAEEVHFNAFVGEQAGNYYFDDFVLEEVTDIVLTAPVPPTQGAFYTDVYRNMFKEAGKSDEAIQAKVNGAFNQLFHGDSANETVYYTTGDDMAFIKDINSKDIRSEGMSYGMMIAVQLNKKDEFDRLWKFAKTYMQHQSGPRAGMFAWQLDPVTFAKKGEVTASDGEEYIATALLFAAHRWGNGEGIFNYNGEAQKLIDLMHNIVIRNNGVQNGLTNVFDTTRKQVVFVPEGSAATFTDPSYHLPGFYKLWALWAKKDNQFWKDVADTSKAFFLRAANPVSGLYTDFMSFEGKPYAWQGNSNSDKFSNDAFRVITNISMDAHWFGADWQIPVVNKMLNFFNGFGPNYRSLYTYEGTPLPDSVNYQSAGHVAMNGSGALASSEIVAWDFVNGLYDKPMSTGQYRYYDGLLQMLALLHSSGNFRIWKPEVINGVAENRTNLENFSVFPNPASGEQNLRVISEVILTGEVVLKDVTGKSLKTASLENGNATIETADLRNGVYFIQVSSDRESFVKKVIKQ